MIQHDRKIAISAAGSRRATHWPAQTLWWSEMIDRLRIPARGTESMAEYLRLPKSKQDDLKDVGGYVYGVLKDGRRKAGSVTGRDALTLDLDSIPAGGTADVLRRIDALGCGYAVYSTRKHSEAGPRLRVLIPISRTATADEYEPLARKLGSLIGMELCDPSTFEASRLMYWPSCCSDSQYVYTYGDKPFLDADGVLAMYKDWRNVTEWPEVPGVQPQAKRTSKQADPLAKSGVVGAFCRVYDIYKVMAELLPGVYEPCDTGPDRYTYTGGSTTGGAVVYDNGKFLYSHHATDPAGGKLCNAFDLVRFHLYGDKDDDAKPETPVNKLPSYDAMCRFAVSDPQVAMLLNQERYEKATQDFETPPDDNSNWMNKLAVSATTGEPAKTIDNIWIILENDPLIKGGFALNEFANRGEILGPLPWSKSVSRRLWEDNDNQGLYWYMEKTYGITGSAKIDGALSLHSNHHSFNEVTSFLKALVWDGVPRLDTLFIDYLGAIDNLYTRTVTRKAFTAAVARAMHPGVKFDIMTMISGKQGLGKSTLLSKMSKGWFLDSIRSFEGKEASELIQGVWLIEIGELEAFRRSDINRIKQFLSQQKDRYRAAYAKNVKEFPRCCVFFGTTNNNEYLQDRTGNRRFWPVDVGLIRPTKSVFTALDGEIDQIWAEAVIRWKFGESLFLTSEVEQYALSEQEGHREHSPQEGIIWEFLDQKVPLDWNQWSLDRRRMFWSGQIAGDIDLMERDKVCALEIWCEALANDIRYIKNTDAAEINGVIAMIPGWERQKTPGRFGYCKLQRGFRRVSTKCL